MQISILVFVQVIRLFDQYVRLQHSVLLIVDDKVVEALAYLSLCIV